MGSRVKAKEFANQHYKIQVTGRNVLVTDAMKDHAISKVQKLERLSDRIILISITMDIQKNDHIVDIVMKVEHLKIISRASTTDMYVSIDQAVERMEKQLRRYRNRILNHHARGLAVIDMKVNVLNRPVEEEVFEQKELFSLGEVVKEKRRPLKELTLDEAIMKMELSQDNFLIFRNEEDHNKALQVIYRRRDGSYGVIHPE